MRIVGEIIMPNPKRHKMCYNCNKRKNLAWDNDGKLCHGCLMTWRDLVIEQHVLNEIPYHEAEKLLMNRMNYTRLEAENLIHPNQKNWIDKAKPLEIMIDGEVIKFDKKEDIKNG